MPSVEILDISFDPIGVDCLMSGFPSGTPAKRRSFWRAGNCTTWLVTERKRSFTFTFPAVDLAPGDRLRVHTGTGTDSDADLYWGLGRAVWNNTGDTAVLVDNRASKVARLSFPVDPDAVSPVIKELVVDTKVTVPKRASSVDTGVDLAGGDEFALDAGADTILAGVWATGRNERSLAACPPANTTDHPIPQIAGDL